MIYIQVQFTIPNISQYIKKVNTTLLYFLTKYVKILSYTDTGSDNMLSNFHTHTKRCLHAYGSEEDYVKSAVDSGLELLGFSDHAPFPDYDFGYRMPYSELEEYLAEVNRLREIYKDKLTIFKGLEIEYHPKYSDYYKILLEDMKLDYLLLGEHMYTESSGEIKNIFFAESTDDYLSYAQSVCQAIETGFFAVVAHPDIMFINDHKWDNNCEKACRLIAECASANDVILEFNANGFRRNKMLYSDDIVRYPYPHKLFWDIAKKEGVRVIVGSDCHSPDQMYDEYMKKAVHTAQEFGLKFVSTIF